MKRWETGGGFVWERVRVTTYTLYVLDDSSTLEQIPLFTAAGFHCNGSRNHVNVVNVGELQECMEILFRLHD
jgi:hypothetical protein